MRVGLRLEAGTLTPNEMLRLAITAEEQNFDTIWVPEGLTDSVAQLASMATATKKIKLGTGILAIYARTPTLVAMSAGSLDAISNKRFTLGLGVGHKAQAENTHGVPLDQPLVRLAETVEIVRRLLKRETVTFKGRIFNLKESRLGFTPVRAAIPIYIAALGPKMIQKAGEIADGVLLNWASPSYLKLAMQHLQYGADKAGRKLDEIDVACYLRTAVVDKVQEAMPAIRWQIARYAGMPYYRKYFGEMGFAKEAVAAAEAIARKDGKGATKAISEAMVNELAIVGSAAHCRQNIAALRNRGLDMPIVAPFKVGEDPMESFQATVAAFNDPVVRG